MSLYEMVEHPELANPVMIVALEGWIDAGLAASTTVSHLMGVSEPTTVAVFDTDTLFDHRARRPVMHLNEGQLKGLTWPHLEVRAGADGQGNDVLYLVGFEPDHQWKAFSHAVVDLAMDFGARMVVDLGAYPAATPHTRPTNVVSTATTPELAKLVGYLPGEVDVPAGIAAVIAQRCADVGLPAVGLWAQVPHYASAIAAPAATMAHIGMLERVAGLQFPLGNLADQAADTIEHINALVAANPEHQAMIEDLERRLDLEDEAGFALSGDGLVAEVEEFLREETE